MCGRFTLHTPILDLVERFSLHELKIDYAPSYNIAPTQQVLTVISNEETRTALTCAGAWCRLGETGAKQASADKRAT